MMHPDGRGDADPAHRAAVAEARAEREARLRDPMSWLTLVGLHWLAPGWQRFGASPDNALVLRAADGEVPPIAGELEVVDGRVLVHPRPGASLAVDGEPVADGLELLDDEADAPTILALASLRLVLIRRGGRPALRVRDTAAPVLSSFRGLEYFDVNPRWRVTAGLVRAAPGATIGVPDVLGDVKDAPTPGHLEFTVDGQTQRLAALEADDGQLWLVFGDATNRHETYGGGRFLVTGAVQPDDTVEVDFNLAYNPPCAFSPFATCPLPPPGNQLTVRVEAGERVWAAPHPTFG